MIQVLGTTCARKPSPFDVCDEEWTLLPALLPEAAEQRSHPLRGALNGLRYAVKNGFPLGRPAPAVPARTDDWRCQSWRAPCPVTYHPQQAEPAAPHCMLAVVADDAALGRGAYGPPQISSTVGGRAGRGHAQAAGPPQRRAQADGKSAARADDRLTANTVDQVGGRLFGTDRRSTADGTPPTIKPSAWLRLGCFEQLARGPAAGGRARRGTPRLCSTAVRRPLLGVLRSVRPWVSGPRRCRTRERPKPHPGLSLPSGLHSGTGSRPRLQRRGGGRCRQGARHRLGGVQAARWPSTALSCCPPSAVCRRQSFETDHHMGRRAQFCLAPPLGARRRRADALMPVHNSLWIIPSSGTAPFSSVNTGAGHNAEGQPRPKL